MAIRVKHEPPAGLAGRFAYGVGARLGAREDWLRELDRRERTEARREDAALRQTMQRYTYGQQRQLAERGYEEAAERARLGIQAGEARQGAAFQQQEDMARLGVTLQEELWEQQQQQAKMALMDPESPANIRDSRQAAQEYANGRMALAKELAADPATRRTGEAMLRQRFFASKRLSHTQMDAIDAAGPDLPEQSAQQILAERMIENEWGFFTLDKDGTPKLIAKKPERGMDFTKYSALYGATAKDLAVLNPRWDELDPDVQHVLVLAEIEKRKRAHADLQAKPELGEGLGAPGPEAAEGPEPPLEVPEEGPPTVAELADMVRDGNASAEWALKKQAAVGDEEAIAALRALGGGPIRPQGAAASLAEMPGVEVEPKWNRLPVDQGKEMLNLFAQEHDGRAPASRQEFEEWLNDQGFTADYPVGVGGLAR